MIYKKALSSVKQEMDKYIGRTVRVKSIKGKKKAVVREAVIMGTYPSVFVLRVDCDQATRCMSYSYADILTKSIQISLA